jgi:hypothetical protein
MIFSGHASGGTMYTDQGKQPDQTKTNKIKITIRTTIQNHPKENKKDTERKQADDEPFQRQEVYIL